MKEIKAGFLTLLMMFAFMQTLLAQATDPNKNTNVVQPKIMVIPFTKDGEDIRTVLEADFLKREAITKVKNGFDTRGFSTVDFLAKLKQAKDEQLFVDAQTDVKSTFIQFSGADIYVEADVHLNPNGKSAQILLTAYDAATATAYASVVCDSRDHYNTDPETLINAALVSPCPGTSHDDESLTAGRSRGSCLDDFLGILQAKFMDIVQNGRPIKIDFSLSQTASKNFESKVTVNGATVQLQDAIDEWLSAYAVKGNVNMQGQTKTALFYSEVRLPLLDKNGNNLSLNKSGQKITQFLQSIGISSTRSIKNGGIYVTITN